jgi:hypothetical protein
MSPEVGTESTTSMISAAGLWCPVKAMIIMEFRELGRDPAFG